jgi:hypothetical protein
VVERLRTIHVGVGGRGAWPVRLFRAEAERWESVALVDFDPAALATAREASGLPADACYGSLEAALAGHGLYSKEGAVAPQITAISWPPLVWAAGTPQWLDQFKGTGVADVARAWESGGHDILVLPEGSKAWTVMNDPLNRALKGEAGTREAMQESARQLDELFRQRPAAWKS